MFEKWHVLIGNLDFFLNGNFEGPKINDVMVE
jgi:hypothetical protein